MTGYVLRRVATSSGLLVLSSVLIFAVLRTIPGDPTIVALGGTPEGADPKAIAAIRHNLGLDRSVPDQYWHWVRGILHGNFGKSYFSGFPVTTLLAERIGATIELAICALFLGLFSSPSRQRCSERSGATATMSRACPDSPLSGCRPRRSSAGSS